MKTLTLTAVAALAVATGFAANDITIPAIDGVGDVVALTNALTNIGSYRNVLLEPGVYDLKDVAMEADSHLILQYGHWLIGKGEDRGDTILLGGGEAVGKRVLKTTNSNYGFASVSNLTVTGGWTTKNGGGISAGFPQVYYCIISNNYAAGGWIGGGGGQYMGYAENCLFENNRVHNGGAMGGGFYTYGYRGLMSKCKVGAKNCVFRNNVARDGAGGGYYGVSWNGNAYGTTAPAINCTFEGNSGGYWGGSAAYVKSPVFGCTFVENKYTSWTDSSGGALHVEQDHWNGSYVKDCVFRGNTCAGNCICQGAGLYTDGNIPVTGCTFEENVTSREGGGMACNGGMVSNCTFRCNKSSGDSSYHGGALYLKTSTSSNPTFKCVDCTFEGNMSAGRGGAVFASRGIENCTFVTNSAATYGGAVCANDDYPESAVSNCTFIGNAASGSGAIGAAAIRMSGDTPANLDVSGCHFVSNVVAKFPYINLTFRDCVISNHHVGCWLFRDCNFYGSLVADNRSTYSAGGVSVDSVSTAMAYTNANSVFKGNYQFINAITEAKVIVNCTYAENSCDSGLYGDIVRDSALVYNTVFVNNKFGSSLRDFRSGSYPTMVNCTYSHLVDKALPEKCTGCIQATYDQLRFKGERDPEHPYVPRRRSSPLYDAAYEEPWILQTLGEKDFYGNARVFHDKLDIGPVECNDVPKVGLMVGIK